jgi:Ca-activated chloride channel family protein
MARRIAAGLLLTVCALGCSGASSGGGAIATPEAPAPAPAGPALSDPAEFVAPPPLLAASAWKPAPRTAGLPLIHTDPGEVPRLVLATDSQKPLSLLHTRVSAKLTGFVAEVEVSQTYTNPFPTPIEAIYVFPLPENSAVNHLRMVIDRRVIEADVKERSAARRIYTQAKEEGHTAALIEQERPNIFTQSVANVAPGKKIEVVVRYVQDLTYDAGAYEFVFPMVVGPRFMPGAPALDAPPSGAGTKLDTVAVPDGSRISPPYVGRGERSGRDISLEVVADPLVAVTSFEVPTHQVASRRPADGTLRLTLAESRSIPNRDFVLRYRVAEAQPRAALYLGGAARGGEAGSGYFSLVVAPPDLDVDRLVGAREIVFVVDVSGSMSGEPLALCKRAMRAALSRLRPLDTFNILTFSGHTTQAFERPRPANATNLHEALAIVDELSAGGGTYMADAVRVALSPELPRDRHRYVFFMTDGHVGNEEGIIAGSRRLASTAEGSGRSARVFGFGVGSSVNRYLIDGLSRAGNGVAVYASTREDPARGVNRFFHYIDRAVLENLRIDWGGLNVEESFPSPLPDLFASHPVIVHGRYRNAPSGPVVVRGEAQGRSFEIPVRVQPPLPTLANGQVLGTLWARQKVTHLEEQLGLGTDTSAEIRQLGLDFHLVTRFTSLVAVDTSRRVGDGQPLVVQEALDAPEGVDLAMAGADDGFVGGVVGAPPAPESEESDEALVDICRQDPDACPNMDMSKASPTSSAAEESLEVQSRRGCGCRVAGDPEPRGNRAALTVLALGAMLVGRRARRSPMRGALG